MKNNVKRTQVKLNKPGLKPSLGKKKVFYFEKSYASTLKRRFTNSKNFSGEQHG